MQDFSDYPKCDGKLRLPSRRIARMVLNRIRRLRHSSSEPPKRFYRCPKCNDFHLTGARETDAPAHRPKYRRQKFRITY